MGSLGKITASILSAANENSLSLANLKFDFSLMKVEAPAEFTALGSALSSRRRNAAEDGLPHKTARRLGALFEQLIPSTPKLITAYGLRITEIIQTPGINPTGLPSHGPFEAFVGADGTAIWAAATSGVSALGIYLLSCLLARAWDAKESISIWVELVAGRRNEIEKAFKENHLITESSLLSARQDITRQDLALWDASTRAWLRSADQAKAWEQNQLMLILKNINVPFAGGPSTYAKVIETWQQAMTGLENLLCGKPQSILSASVLLALSAWHLFPDLIVLSKETTNVKFKDPLVPRTGIGTVGMQSTASTTGTQWSLTLSHLRYYGGPVPVRSNTEFTRVTIHQLHLVTLGSMFRVWNIRQADLISAAQWFIALWRVLTVNPEGGNVQLASDLRWLYNLAQAAEAVLTSKGKDHSENLFLLKFGQRRAKFFLCLDSYKLSPFFGLCSPPVLAGLSEKLDVECGIRYLRDIARKLGMKSNEVIIAYKHGPHGKSYRHYEYATAVPHEKTSRKRDANGDTTNEKVHARWVQYISDLGDAGSAEHELRMNNNETAQRYRQLRLSELAAQCENGIYTGNGPSFVKAHLEWVNPPPLYRLYPSSPDSLDHPTASNICPSVLRSKNLCDCFNPDQPILSGPRCPSLCEGGHLSSDCDGQAMVRFCPLLEVWPLGLYVRKEVHGICGTVDCYESKYSKKVEAATGGLASPALGLKMLMDPSICKGRLADYLRCVTRISSEETTAEQLEVPGVYLMAHPHRFPPPCVRSLHAMSLASQVYENLDGATISLKLVADPLHNALWIPSNPTRTCVAAKREGQMAEQGDPILQARAVKELDRLQTFACIAMFESGSLNLDPVDLENTLALCSENSIYVAGVVLSDPFEIVPGYDIRRIVGNIGRSGICMLVAPQDPKIRSLSDKYNVVTHAPYDSKREDNFKATTLHLSFTDWVSPLLTAGTRSIDHDVHIVECVISAWDGGEWVADLDILGVDFEGLIRLKIECQCLAPHDNSPKYDYTSLDSWEELLDGPESVGIFRAHGNWAARLAAVSIISQQGQAHSIGVYGTEKTCLRCLEASYEKPEWGLLEFESPLPSFCID